MIKIKKLIIEINLSMVADDEAMININESMIEMK